MSESKQFLKFLAVCVCGGTAGAFAMHVDKSGLASYLIGMQTGLVIAGLALEK